MKAYIHTVGGRPFNEKCETAQRGFEKLGIECVSFSSNEVLDESNREDVIVGGILVTGHALAARGIKPPSLDYPKSLSSFLGRRVCKCNVGVINKGDLPLFIKPANEKELPGGVTSGGRTLLVGMGVLDDLAKYVALVFPWVHQDLTSETLWKSRFAQPFPPRHLPYNVEDANSCQSPIPTPDQTEAPGLKDNVLYLYIDESGNLDFSKQGTEWFIVTGVVMRRPFDAATSLLTYKYDCIEDGIDLERFHASEDVDTVRTGVYARIGEHSSECKAYSAKVHKPTLPESVKDPAKVYSLAFDWLIDEAVKGESLEEIAEVIVVTDSLPKDAKRRQVEKPLKAFMKRHFQDVGIPYALLHHKSESDPNLQVADYMCWAVHRSEVKGLDWPMSKVKDVMESVSEVIVA